MTKKESDRSNVLNFIHEHGSIKPRDITRITKNKNTDVWLKDNGDILFYEEDDGTIKLLTM